MSVHEHEELTITLPTPFTAGKVGIVTVTYNSAFVLEDFFASLDRQTYDNFILIVVDNASQDETLTLLEAHHSNQQIILANTLNLGVAAGNNQGIRSAIESGCEYVMLVNNDVVLDTEMVARLVQALVDRNCSMTVPMMYFHAPPDRIWAAGGGFRSRSGFRVYHRHANEKETPQSRQPTQIDYTPTCCVLIRRDVFARIGLMDERYFVYSDDVDFMFRAKNAGLILYFIPDAKLWHKVNALAGAESDFTYYYGARGRALFLYKNMSRTAAFVWTRLHLGFDIWRALFRRNFRRPCTLKWRGMRDGRKVALES